jgi:hypothetical protein
VLIEWSTIRSREYATDTGETPVPRLNAFRSVSSVSSVADLLLRVLRALRGSQNKLRQILVLHRLGEALADVVAGDGDGFLVEVGGVEADLFEGSFEDGVEASGADVGGAAVEPAENGMQ